MRLIDADAMEKLMSDTVQGDIRGYPYSDTTWDMVFRWIDHQPTIDAVPVVRCGDCKNYNTNGCADGFGWCEHSGNGHGSTDNWFCADGERRDDDAAD